MHPLLEKILDPPMSDSLFAYTVAVMAEVSLDGFQQEDFLMHCGMYRAFSHDVTAAILVFQNNETAAMLVYQENPLGVELFSHVNAFFSSNTLA